MARLSVRGLTKSFGARPVLGGVHFEVAAGALVAVLGASGSGKTTLMRIICGFERADAGLIDIGGRTASGPGVHAPAERRRIGYVAQEGALFPHLSVMGNVGFGLPRAERRDRARIEALLVGVGLPASYADRQPHQLSGGEQQRVALARALAPNPSLVLLDEPFSSLDAALRAETREAVAAALAASGATAVLVTHDQSEALSMASAVAVLRDGVIAQFAAPQTLYREPVDVAMARFVGEAVILLGNVEGEWVDCGLGRLPLARPAREGPAEVMLRPEQIRLAGANGVVARVIDVQFHGCDALARLLVGDEIVVSRLPGHHAPRRGDEVRVEADGSAVAYPQLSARPAFQSFVNPEGVATLRIEENQL